MLALEEAGEVSPPVLTGLNPPLSMKLWLRLANADNLGFDTGDPHESMAKDEALTGEEGMPEE